MYGRKLSFPSKSFLLLGPRGTGKSTWLSDHKYDLQIDLLSSKDLLEYRVNPDRLYQLGSVLKPGSWVLIDEVQKVPQLLDEVQRLYEEKKLNFALSGSSARKLKRSGANLLAGRAINLEIFPLCYAEYQDTLDLDFRINWGTLPLIVDNREYLEDTATTYVHNYLRQELAEEGIVRNLESFARFLSVAALYHGKMLSYQAVAEQCHVPRQTVAKYFEILTDTLVAYLLPAWKPRLKVKEIKTPKFYLFDPGVARTCLGLRNEIDRAYLGYLLENLIINEVKAYNSYFKRRADLYYYAVSDSFEVDLVIDLGQKQGKATAIAIEIKLAERWDPRWSDAINAIADDPKIKIERKIGIYTGKEKLVVKEVEIFPVDMFLGELFAGTIY